MQKVKTLPHGAMGWSVVCDCGISWSYSLTFCMGSSEQACLLAYPISSKTSWAGLYILQMSFLNPFMPNVFLSPFPILGLLGDILHFYSNFKRNFCLQTVENLIRRHVLRHLIWFCTVYRCPTKKDARLIWVKQPGKGSYCKYKKLDFCSPDSSFCCFYPYEKILSHIPRTKVW